MCSSQYIVCLVLLVPVCTRAKNLAITETTELMDYSGRDGVEKEYNLKDENSTKIDVNTSEFADTKYSLEELLKDDNDTDIESLLTAEMNESFSESTNGESVIISAKPTTANPGFNGTVRSGKILGGTAVTAGQNSYNVFVEGTTASATGTSKFCGGAILSVSWVVTAAQCVATAATIIVYSGVLEDPVGTGTKTSALPYIHPGFKRNFLLNDIALLRLLTPLAISSTTGVIRIHSSSISGFDNVAARTFGYGPSDDSQALASTATDIVLKFVDLNIVKKASCISQTDETYVAYPGNTGCLSTSLATKGICFADAGGPVVYTTDADGTDKLIGINSLYLGCPSSYPSSFTLIHPFIGWIKSITKKTFT
ncbi:brachyurin-like [Cloeon dipterum]|uniref:brachyurin-like n=1 Tax=Cloeon dipterum TaxID=197152 RepID=UPI00321FBD1E